MAHGRLLLPFTAAVLLLAIDDNDGVVVVLQPCLLRALGIFVRCLGEHHERVIETLTSLATLCNSYVEHYHGFCLARRMCVGVCRVLVVVHVVNACVHSLGEASEAETYNQRAIESQYLRVQEQAVPTAGGGGGAAAGSEGEEDESKARDLTQVPSGRSWASARGARSIASAGVSERSLEDPEGDVCDEFKTFDWTKLVVESSLNSRVQG